MWRPVSACAGEVGRDLAVGGGSIRSWICEEAGARARCTGGCTPPPSPRVQRRPREELEPQRWSTAPASAGGAWAVETAGSVRLSRCRPSTRAISPRVLASVLSRTPSCLDICFQSRILEENRKTGNIYD